MGNSDSLIFVIDTSALIGHLGYAAAEAQFATTPSLLEEMKRKKLDNIIQTLLNSGKLRIIEPTSSSINTVVAAAAALGDLQYLSEPDQQLLALALDLTKQGYDAVVLTNDYAIQNIASSLSIKFRSVGEHGIREIIKWKTYCPGCTRQFPKRTKGEICPHCGTPLKRRAVNKERL
ncbi:MAG: NOB1 family endonuclease [Promethearchaeota archaeon]